MITEENCVKVIGKNIRRILEQEEILQKELAEWTGIHKNTLNSTIRGRNGLTAYRLYLIAKTLQRPMESFFKEDEA